MSPSTTAITFGGTGGGGGGRLPVMQNTQCSSTASSSSSSSTRNNNNTTNHLLSATSSSSLFSSANWQYYQQQNQHIRQQQQQQQLLNQQSNHLHHQGVPSSAYQQQQLKLQQRYSSASAAAAAGGQSYPILSGKSYPSAEYYQHRNVPSSSSSSPASSSSSSCSSSVVPYFSNPPSSSMLLQQQQQQFQQQRNSMPTCSSSAASAARVLHHQQQQQQSQYQNVQRHLSVTASSSLTQQQHQQLMLNRQLQYNNYHLHQAYGGASLAYRTHHHPSFLASSSASVHPFYMAKMSAGTSVAYPTISYPSSSVSSALSSINSCSSSQLSSHNHYGIAGSGGAEFGQFSAATPPFGQYQPPQWAAAFQQQQPPQGMYPSPRMAPPPQQQQQQMMRQAAMAQQHFGANNGQGDDEQQQQQRPPQVSSRLSTPAPPQTADQRPISRASTGGDQSQQQRTMDQHQQQDERGEAGAVQQQQQQQQQRRAQTPSAATFSANAPTPPLTTSSASGVQPPLPPPSSTGAGVPFYHPGVPYGVGRYPPTVANEAAAMYGPAGPSAAMYSPSQQQLAAVAHQQRYQQQQQAAAAAAAASARYYPSMPGASTSVPPQHQQQAQKGAVTSSTAKPLPQQHFVPPPPSFYAAGNRSSNAAAALLGVVPPPPMLPPSVGGSAVVGPPPPAAYATQQQQPPYAMPSSSSASAVQTTAWHYAQQQQHQFPANSLEAQVIAQVQQQTKRSREKVYARDLYGATPARIVMALRSALHTETVWALNALNVQLYDDTTLPTHAAPSLAQTPELLNLLVDHLAAALSLLFPDHFNATSFFLGSQKRPPVTKNDNDDTSDKLKKQKRKTPPTTTPSSVVSSTKINGAIVNGGTNNGNGGGALLAVPKQEQPPPPFMLLDKVEVLVPNMSSAFTTAATTAASPRHAVAVPSSNGGRQSNRHHHNGGTGIADNNNKVNFTRVSRLGRPVKWDTGELPPALARELQLTVGQEEDDERGEEKAEEMPLFLHFVERVRQSVLGNVCARRNATNRQTTKAFGRAQKTMKDNGKENEEFWEPSEEGRTMEAEEKQQKTEDGAKSDEYAVDAAPRRVRLFFHRADDDDDDHSGGGSGGCSHCLNRWHTDNRNSVRSCRCTGTDHHFSLLSRPVGLQDAHADERMAALVEQCLALANILRGYAFLPGHERTLATHGGLLRLLSALMMLMVDKKQHKRAKPTTKRTAETAEKSGMDNDEMGTDTAAPGEYHPQGIKLNTNCNNTTKPTTLKEGVKQETEDENQQTVVEEGEKNLPKVAEKMAKTEETTTLEEDDVNSKPTATTTTPAVAVVGPAPEADTRQKWLLQVANQLRDDAFVIMAQLSAHLDLFDLDSAISWPIFDALLHWSVSSDLQARDPLPPFGVISPRHYAFEILCKMSVLERNVDLLVSTGPWPRLEAFVRLLCAQICEEPPVREFAIVILNAVCAVSEPACFVAAVETPLLEHLVSFLEAADANMTQIVQQQGMHALRENPEIIGTSVGMLRRATTIMVQIAKHEQCRRHFRRLQHRLLQFTVSHFMDLRVAAMVANILFEIQRGDSVPLLPPPSSAEAKRGGNDGTRSANTAASTSPKRRTESPADAAAAETGRKSAEAKTMTAATGKECRATPTPFLLGGSVNSHVALFNGTTTTTMCSSAAEGIDNICSTFNASSACATSSQYANTANVYVPPKVNKRENNGKEEEEDSANECYGHADGNDGGDNRSNKTDMNRGRKRMFNNNNNNSSNYNENDYQKWNGHHPANAQHSPIETVVDQMPTETRLRMDEGEEVASPSSVSAGGNAVVMNNGRSSVKVRERMRHNILSKKASLKAASAAATSFDKEAAVPTVPLHRPPNKRNNGWIGAGGDDDGEGSGADPKKKKKLLHNGTAEAGGGANKNDAEMATAAAQNPSSASPAGTSGGGGGGSSLTAVA
ncbi:hypothetical protein niasHT_019578 [Heterodera trifolii]|uniref:SWI/SNF-like complex subunit BAF250 C-terminal domain-containing protein n=1 Tax=Heterodera trifolii TaxID=157864 RepID=A0ABD2L868_9BILA